MHTRCHPDSTPKPGGGNRACPLSAHLTVPSGPGAPPAFWLDTIFHGPCARPKRARTTGRACSAVYGHGFAPVNYVTILARAGRAPGRATSYGAGCERRRRHRHITHITSIRVGRVVLTSVEKRFGKPKVCRKNVYSLGKTKTLLVFRI